MKFLWAFLLLAFTIDSVYSQGYASSQHQQKLWEQAMKNACGGVNGAKIPPLIPGGLLTSVLGQIISTFTNVMLLNPNVVNINVKVTETGLSLEANFTLGMSCDQFGTTIPTLNITIKANLTVDVDKYNGCIIYILDDKSITFKLSINGNIPTLILNLLNGILSIVTSTLNSLFKGVIVVAVSLINEGSRAIPSIPFMLGNAMCSYVVSGIQYNNGAHNVLFNIIYNGGKIESPGSPTSIPPAPNTGYSMIFTTYMVSGGIGLTLNGLSVQITLDISQVKAGLPGTDPNANYHVEIKFTAVKDCKLQEGSGSVTVSLNVSLKASEKVIANVAANVKLDLRVEYKGGSMSLNVNVNAGAEITFTSGDGSAAGEFLKKVCGMYLGVWVDKVNCNLGIFLPVWSFLGPGYSAMPLPPASPPTSPVSPTGQCVFGDDSCICTAT